MDRNLARDILKAVQNTTNHFVASFTAKVGSTIRLTHPVGKAIFAQALTPLSGSCLVFEQNGQWFAIAGAERTETNSTTVVSRRSRPRGKISTEFEVAYLFTETVDDDSQLPFVYTVYGLNTTKMACQRRALNRRESNYETPEDCKKYSTFSTLDAPYNNYFTRQIYRTNNIGFYGVGNFDPYAYEGDNSEASSQLQSFINFTNNENYTAYKSADDADIYEDENYLVVASGNTTIVLVYQRFVEGGTALQYMTVGYRMDLGQATGSRYHKSISSYIDFHDNQIYSGQTNFPFPHTPDQILSFSSQVDGRLNTPNANKFNELNPSLSISLNCSHVSSFSYFTSEEQEGSLPFRIVYGETSLNSLNFGGTGTILGSALKAGGLTISTTLSGTVPSSVQFFTAYYNGAPRNAETFYYAGFFPVNFARSYTVSGDFATRLFGVSAYQEYKTIETTGKKVFYFQRKNEQPIKVLELPKQEGFQNLMTSSLTGFSIIIKAGFRQTGSFPYNPLGWYRVFLIEVPNNSRTPQVEFYNYLDNDTIPIPENNWLSLHYTFRDRRSVETSPSDYGTSQDALTLSSSLPYWHNPLYPANFIFVKFTDLVANLTTNINTFNSGKTLFYFEAGDLKDQEPILYTEPLVEPIFINSFTIGYQASRNADFVISAFLTGNFTNKRLFKVSQLPESEQTPGELLKYSSPTAISANLYPLNIGIDLASLSTAEIESVIKRHNLLAIIPYQAVVTKKTFVSQQVNFPLADAFGGD